MSVSDLNICKAQRSVFGDQSKWQEAARRVTSSFGRGVVQLAELQGKWFVACTIHGPIEKPLDGPPRAFAVLATGRTAAGGGVCNFYIRVIVWLPRLKVLRH